MANWIVLRPSPDWPTFDLADSRRFLSDFGFDPDLLIDFVAIWDRTFTVDYRTLRERLKTLSLASYRSVRDCRLLPLAEFRAERCGPDDRVVFADDDDWLAPDLFTHLAGDAADGYRWGSLRVGLDFDPTAPGAALCSLRPLNRVLYTNNYALSGAGIARSSWTRVIEHHGAQYDFAEPDFVVRDLPLYLSCAVKHPCSTVAVRAMMQADFRRDPDRSLMRFRNALATAEPPIEGAWAARSLRDLRTVFDAVCVRT